MTEWYGDNTLAEVGGFVIICLHGCLLLWSYSYGKGTCVFSCVVFVDDEKMLILKQVLTTAI